MRDDEIWDDLWRCTLLAKKDGYKLELCLPDEEGRKVAELMRFFDLSDIEEFLSDPHCRADILLKAYECKNSFLSGKKLSGRQCGDKIEWTIQNAHA